MAVGQRREDGPLSEPLTVAIPYHRGLAYLKEAVASVLAQDRDDWRLCVVDDSGGDEAAAAWLAAQDESRLEVHRNPRNLGMVASWNRCLELAPSDRVTLLHADDRLGPGYVSLMQGLAAEHPEAAAFFCEAEIIDARGGPRFSLADRVKPWLRPRGGGVYTLEGETALRALVRGNFIMCPTLCFRRSRLAGRRFQERWRQVQDLELTTRLLLEGERLVGSRRVAYAYRRHDEGATARQSASLLRFREELALLGEVAERAGELRWHRAARAARHRGIVRLHLLYRAGADALHGRWRRAAAEVRLAWRGRAA